MKIKRALFPVLLLFAACLPLGQASADQAEDEAAIRDSVKAYVAAFNRQEASTLAAQWSPEAVYTNPFTGHEVVGREEIEKELSAIFKESPNLKLEVDVESVEFVSPNVAVEKGIARVLRAEESPDETTYSAVHIKIDGKWYVDRMTEQPMASVSSNYEHLQQLEWLIGNWVDQDENATIETSCQWTKNQNFISRAFTVSIDGDIDLSGMQLIGWDASKQKIRSWVFDSDGGFGEATWSKKGESWVISASGTLPDGRKTSATNIITFVDENTITWQSSGRELDGEILPSIEPIQIARKTDSE